MKQNEASCWSEQVQIIAEIGMTHDGSFGLAKNLISSAAQSGAHIVKLQWHIAEEETVQNAPSPPYFTNETRFDYFKRTEFTADQFRALHEHCQLVGVKSCVSVFSIESAMRAIASGFQILKIPSGEVTNLPLLDYINTLDVPVLLSSGMSSWTELDRAVLALSKVQELGILQCSSKYPTYAEHVGLNVLGLIAEKYDRPVGLSDHTLSTASSVAAVCFGAKIIEKHFTLSKDLYGPDARFSLDPNEFRKLVDDANFVFEALQSPVDKNEISHYSDMKNIFQKSIVARNKIRAGQSIQLDDLAFKKPGNGICASAYKSVVGLKASKNYEVDELISESEK